MPSIKRSTRTSAKIPSKPSPKFSANLGFLWPEYDLLEGIRAAATAGFAAVECHWPFAYPAQIVLDILSETGLVMIALNTYPGKQDKGDFGVCAHPDRVLEAHQVIDQAIAYAAQINTPNVHVMAGKVAANADHKLAMQTFLDNLVYASQVAEPYGIDILIEPINNIDVADYFVSDMSIACDIVKKINAANVFNVKIMFDCFHIQKVHGELKKYIEQHLELIGHIQIASFPERHEPDEGVVDYLELLGLLERLGYAGYIGAEYNARTTTDEGLAWLHSLSSL